MLVTKVINVDVDVTRAVRTKLDFKGLLPSDLNFFVFEPPIQEHQKTL